MKFRIYFIVISLFSLILMQHNHEDHNYEHMDGIIKGSVIDNLTKAPRKYASISIVRVDNDEIIARGMSHEFGIFEIDKVPYGNYYVVIEHIGFEDYLIDDIKIYPPNNLNIDIGVVQIIMKALTSDVVSVMASPIIEDIEKTTYPVAKTARAMGGTADEILEQLPSISVDMDGNITLRGNSNVTILVDGRKSLINVDMLNANMIEKVEVMTTPSAKYDPDGIAGIINVILVKNEYVGKTGNINTNLSERNGKNLSGTFNLFKTDWNIFTTYSLSSKYKPGRGFRDIIYSEGDIETSSIHFEDRSERYPERQNLKLGIERYFTDESLLAFDLTYINHIENDSTFTTTTDNLINELDTAFTIIDGSGYDLNYGIGYFVDNKKDNKSFAIQFDYDDHNDEETNYYITDSESILNTIDDVGVTKTFTIDYSAPIDNSYNNKSNYEVGMKLNTEVDIHYANIEQEPFEWKSDNSISSLYFNTAYYFTESFGIQLGARYEIQDKESVIDYNENIECTDLTESECSGFCSWDDGNCVDNIFSIAMDQLIDDGLDFSYEHNRIYPSLYFLYDLKEKGNLKFELGRRINRPWHRATDPIPDVSESESGFIHQGNPSLKPEDIYKTEISYSNRLPFGYLKTAIYYTQITDKIDRDKDTRPIEIDGEVYQYQILSWDNIGKSYEQGIELTFMTQPLPNWDLMLNGNYWHNEFVEAEEEDQLGSEYGFWGMMTSKFSLKNNQQISLYAHYSTPMVITTGEISSFKRMDISYMKKINDKFNFTIKLKDAFDTGGFHIITNQILEDTDPEVNEYLIADHRRGKRTISINFEFKFGQFNKKKYRRQDGHGHSHGEEGMDGGY